jgi:hypothetical protein
MQPSLIMNIIAISCDGVMIIVEKHAYHENVIADSSANF